MTDSDYSANRETVSFLLAGASERSEESQQQLAEELLPMVYEELKRLAGRQMAQERPGQTIQPTALVHEAYMRLVSKPDLKWDGRRHFFAAAARSMRQILINRANRKKAQKHGGDRRREEWFDVPQGSVPEDERILALDSALLELEQIDPRKGEIVNLRYFAGLSIEETAKAMDLSAATVKRDWQFSRTWLHRRISQNEAV